MGEIGLNYNDRALFITTFALALVMVAVISVMLVGLFDSRVDNGKVFEILGPAFQTIVGCFVGVVGSRIGGNKESK